MSDSLEPAYGIPSPALGAWADSLQPASWRGIPFAVENENTRVGRRIALHEYAFRDDPWPEDVGRGTRRVNVTGFLVGDDVYDQRATLIDAMQQPGSGVLVHPSLGSLNATLDGDFTSGTRKDLGRVVQIEFTVIWTGQTQPMYPAGAASTQDGSFAAAANCDAACGSDFTNDVMGALESGEAVVDGAVGAVLGFAATVIGTAQAVAGAVEQAIELPAQIIGTVLADVGQVSGLVNDAAIVAGVAVGLVGNFGRYAFGNLTAPLPPTATVQTQIAAQTVTRAAALAACGTAVATAASGPLGLPGPVQGAVAALLATVPNPADQLRLLTSLAGFQPVVTMSSAPIGVAIATTQIAIGALVRRAACAALARAAAAYQPTSYNDAVAQLDALTALFDAEMEIAADDFDDGSYAALRALRTAVGADLIARGSGLPQLITVTRPASLPSLVLAYQLYADATRSDDLIARADPISPMFMPTSFVALSS